jgi:putative pyoverdin transport system ATP-binding/permease protein
VPYARSEGDPVGRRYKMRLLLSLLEVSRMRIALALVASLVSGIGGALLVALINEALVEGAHRSTLALKFAVLSLAVLLGRWLSESQFVFVSQASLARLRVLVSRNIAEAPYPDIEKAGAPRLLSILTEDVSTVATFFMALPELVMHGAVVLACLGYLGFLSWKVFLFAVLAVALGSIGYQLAQRAALLGLRTARHHEDRLFQHFRALLEGAKELKLHRQRREEFLDRCLASSVELVRGARTAGLRISVTATSWGSFLFFVLIGSVLFLLGNVFELSGRVMSGYALMFLYMMLPLEAVLGAIPNLNRTRVALERIQAIEAAPTVVPPPSNEAATGFRCVRLEQATHRYLRDNEDGTFVLGPLDLSLNAGEILFVVGGNGSGKTTLAKLLVGLYHPESGSAFLNDSRIAGEAWETYRQQFSAVFSDFFLFESVLGSTGVDDERVATLLALLQLDHKVRVDGGVFSTTALSQGQRKRLALLVTYLEDRPVYVFDEWAADQDPTFKDVFYRRLLPDLKARGKAVLVITHDDRYFDAADRIIRLESGQLLLNPAGVGTEMVDGWPVAS